jgi:hypothetical protein
MKHATYKNNWKLVAASRSGAAARLASGASLPAGLSRAREGGGGSLDLGRAGSGELRLRLLGEVVPLGGPTWSSEPCRE